MYFVLRWLLLPCFALAGLFVYTGSLKLFSALVATGEFPASLASLPLQLFFAAAMTASLLCYPLDRVFRRQAPLAALLVSLSLLLLPSPTGLDGNYPIFAWATAIYEVLAYGLLLIVATRLAHRRAGWSFPRLETVVPYIGGYGR